MIRFSIVLIGIMMSVNALWSDNTWDESTCYLFKEKVSFQYEIGIDKVRRTKNCLKNLKEIAQHNEDFKRGKVSYEKCVNKFIGMNEAEFEDAMAGFKENIINHSFYHQPLKHAKIPDSIDWREAGAVTRVKSQLFCSVCWAFASIGAVESAYFRKHKKLVEFSEQNLVDCVQPDEQTCYLGGLQRSFNYIQAHGIATYKSYPYTSIKGKCQHKRENSPVRLSHFVKIPKGDEVALTNAIATIGPVTVTMGLAFSLVFYKNGIYYDENCIESAKNKVLHSVLAVGYGTDDDGNDYYLLKNSWGPMWGDNGYFKMARNRNSCNITMNAGYPVLED